VAISEVIPGDWYCYEFDGRCRYGLAVRETDDYINACWGWNLDRIGTYPSGALLKKTTPTLRHLGSYEDAEAHYLGCKILKHSGWGSVRYGLVPIDYKPVLLDNLKVKAVYSQWSSSKEKAVERYKANAFKTWVKEEFIIRDEESDHVTLENPTKHIAIKLDNEIEKTIEELKENSSEAIDEVSKTINWLAEGVDEVSRDIDGLRHDMANQYTRGYERDNLAARRNYELQSAIDELKTSLHEVTAEVISFGERLGSLERRKLDRPSYSEELTQAQLYVDDLAKVGRKERAKAFSARQNIKKTLRKAEDTSKKKNNAAYLAFLSALIGVLAAYLVF